MKLLVASVLFSSAYAACPNSCSGHGTCNGFEQCTCFKETPIAEDDFKGTIEVEWTGADCSRRTCARGISWVKPSSDDAVCSHQAETECSDQGLCDRATGLCTCFPGYSGRACSRTVCPNDCSGHGTCRSNQDFAYDWSVAKTLQLLGDNADDDQTERFEQNYIATYDDAWDSGMHQGCKCDAGYRGPDCSMIECPSTTDPLDDKCDPNTITDYRLQTDTAIGAAGWESVYSVAEAPEFTDDDSETFQNPNNLKVDGSVSRNVYSCLGAMAGQDCSGRGICDYSSGQCACFSGYAGTACEEVQEMA